MMKKKKKTCLPFLLIALLAGAITGCGSGAQTTQQKQITQVLDWFVQPTHGGLFAAQAQSYYKDAGLDVTIQPGGPQVSSIQIVAAGKADFGMQSADALLIARDQGIPVVAVAAFLQKGPSALFFHKEDSIKDFADLNNRKVYAALSAPYWEYLKKSYKLQHVQEMQFTGQYANFVNDPKAVTQGYVTNTPADLGKQGVEVNHLLVADSGYNPYYSVIFTSESYLKEHPEEVKAYVQASLKGWEYYKENNESVSKLLKEHSKDSTIEGLNSEAAALNDFVFGGDAAVKGVGYMSKERWETLGKQLHEIGLLKQEPDVTKAFTTEFLPQK